MRCSAVVMHNMKNIFLRVAVSGLGLVSLLAGSGCASFAEGLALAAEEIRAQQEAEAYYDYYYLPERAPSDTSAAGIK